MGCHLAVGLAAALCLFLIPRKAFPRDTVLDVAVCASLAISPYTYDYDLVSLSLLSSRQVSMRERGWAR